ncbi:MAG: hypothetical protein K8823_1543 [Cenarchaeum symbiont of Oopsacas minuta]|nr:hypothetical protein [Cenarchaeum symbiont of Oopsacas minuta]
MTQPLVYLIDTVQFNLKIETSEMNSHQNILTGTIFDKEIEPITISDRRLRDLISNLLMYKKMKEQEFCDHRMKSFIYKTSGDKKNLTKVECCHCKCVLPLVEYKK